MSQISAATSTLLEQARASHDGQHCMALYDKWAATYNNDLAPDSQDYVAPLLTAQTALQFSPNRKGAILDAGCGTGLVGEALTLGGATVVDGLDLSPAMLKVAEKTGVYRHLDVGDMTKPLAKPSNMYDVITCAGTFTHGHVGPDPALRELVRLARRGGVVVATVIEDLWQAGGFQAEVEKLAAEGLVKVASLDLKDYVKGRGDKARFVVLEKTGPPPPPSDARDKAAPTQPQRVADASPLAQQPLLQLKA